MPNYLSGDLCLTLPMLHPMQQVINDDPRRFKVLSCGRRFGKTSLGIHRILGCIMQNRPFGWFAATIKLMEKAWRDICKTLAPIIERKSDQTKFIKFRSDLFGSDAEFEGWSFEGQGEGRSREFGEIFIDEAGMIPKLKKIFDESLCWCMADYEAPCIIAGTPFGIGDFSDIWDRGQSAEWPEWGSWMLRGDCNPKPAIRREYLRLEKELSADTFAQEGCGKFLQDSGGVFRNVRQCSTVSREDYIYNPNHTYLLTADWGRSNDFSVFSVWDMDTYCQVELKRSNKVEYDEQREVLKDLYRGWHLCEENCRVEGNSIGHENAQQLRKDGYPVTEFYTNNERKSRWVDELAGSLEHQRIRLINDPVQIKELQSYERSSTPGEKFKYGAPTGQHDDTVITAMTANHYLKTEDWSDLSDTTTAAKTPERAELDAYNAEWAERMKSLREQTFPSNAVDDFLNEGVYA